MKNVDYAVLLDIKPQGEVMSIHSIEDAQQNLKTLIAQVTESHQPVTIQGDRNNNVVLLAEADWTSIQETLYLLSIPGMRESIQTGLATPIEDCDEVLDW